MACSRVRGHKGTIGGVQADDIPGSKELSCPNVSKSCSQKAICSSQVLESVKKPTECNVTWHSSLFARLVAAGATHFDSSWLSLLYSGKSCVGFKTANRHGPGCPLIRRPKKMGELLVDGIQLLVSLACPWKVSKVKISEPNQLTYILHGNNEVQLPGVGCELFNLKHNVSSNHIQH